MTTFDNIANEYFELKKSIWSKHTYKTNLSNYNNHIAPYLGLKSIDAIHFIEYQRLANTLLERPLKPKTVKNIFVVLSGIVNYAIKMDMYLGKNYLEYVELPEFDNKQYFSTSKELQVKYIRALMSFNEPIYKDIFFFLLHGRRLGEVLGLEWEYIDLEQRIMYLPSAKNKSRKNLQFELTNQQVVILREYEREARQTQKTAMLKGYVFFNPKTLTRYTDIRRAWDRLLYINDLPKIRIHDIRHLVGTYLINELDISIEHVSHLLGHSSIQVTQRYINPKPSNSKNAMDKLFKSVRTKGELAVDEVNRVFSMGEHLQEILKLNDE